MQDVIDVTSHVSLCCPYRKRVGAVGVWRSHVHICNSILHGTDGSLVSVYYFTSELSRGIPDETLAYTAKIFRYSPS